MQLAVLPKLPLAARGDRPEDVDSRDLYEQVSEIIPLQRRHPDRPEHIAPEIGRQVSQVRLRGRCAHVKRVHIMRCHGLALFQQKLAPGLLRGHDLRKLAQFAETPLAAQEDQAPPDDRHCELHE